MELVIYFLVLTFKVKNQTFETENRLISHAIERDTYV